MKLKVKSAAVAVAATLAAGMAAATGTSAGTSDAGRTVLGESPRSVTTTSVYAVDEAEFLRLDADKDGRLSRAEAGELNVLQQDWSSVDRDGDAYLSREELARYHAEGRSTAAASPSTAPGHAPSQTLGMDDSPPAAASGRDPADVLVVIVSESDFVRLDKDGDGRLSRGEVTSVGRLQQSWAAVDRDGDSYVTRQELDEYHARLGRASGGQASEPAVSPGPMAEPPGGRGRLTEPPAGGGRLTEPPASGGQLTEPPGAAGTGRPVR